MTLLSILLMAHSILRWVIVIVALVAGVKFLIGWLRDREYDRTDRILTASYSGLIDLQVLLGLIFFIWTGIAESYWPLFRFEHLFVMVLAAVAAHAPMRWAGAPDKIRYRNNLLAIVASLILIFVGVSLLPGGWTR